MYTLIIKNFNNDIIKIHNIIFKTKYNEKISLNKIIITFYDNKHISYSNIKGYSYSNYNTITKSISLYSRYSDEIHIKFSTNDKIEKIEIDNNLYKEGLKFNLIKSKKFINYFF